jgi:restriction endonuclease S subunit
LRLVIDETRASKEYLLLALRAPIARAHIERYATGTSDSMRNISQPVITSIPIELPVLEEQCRIAWRLKAKLAEITVAEESAVFQLQEIQTLPAKLLSQAFAN